MKKADRFVRRHAAWALSLILCATAALVPGAAIADPTAGAGDAVLQRSQHAAAAEMQRWRDERTSPAQRAKRGASRDEHRGLDRAEARRLARSKFPEALTGDAAAPFVLPKGMEIAKLLSPQSATVQTAAGEPMGVLNAYGPLAAERDGKASLVRLDLEARDGAFVPRNPQAAYRLPQKASSPVQLEKTGVQFRFAGADGVEGQVDDNRLFYANAGTDLDYILTPKAAGAEALWQIRSAAAPETVELEFDLPAGATLRRAPQFGKPEARQSIVVVDAAGDVLASVTPPVAYAADRMGIKVQTEIKGNVLAMTVKHVGEDVMYPILLDPQVAEVWATAYGFQNCGNTVNGTGGAWTNQQYIHNGGEYYYQACDSPAHTHGSTTIPAHAYGYGLYSWQRDGGWYGAGSVAQWSWWAPADAFVQSVSWSGLRHEPAYDYTGYTNAFVAIHRDTPGAWLARYDWGHAAHWNYTQYASEHSPTTRAVFGISSPFTGNYWNGGMVGLEGAYIVINDSHPPAIALSNHSPTMAGSPPETPWIDPTKTAPQMSFSMSDRGLGLMDYAVVRDDNGAFVKGWTRVPNVNGGTCNGSRSNPCRTSWPSGWVGLDSPGSLPDGVISVHAEVRDINGLGGRSPSWRLRVDKTPPALPTVSGDLVKARNQYVQPDGAYGITASSSDSGSGIARIRVRVNGNDGPSLGNPMTWTFRPREWAADANGRYDVQIIAEDAVGRASTEHIYMWAQPNGTQIQPGDNVVEDAAAPETDFGCAPDPAIPGDMSCNGATAEESEADGEPAINASAPVLASASSATSGTASTSSSSPSPMSWGMGDNNPSMFRGDASGDLRFKNLGVRRVRLQVRWDIMNGVALTEADFDRIKASGGMPKEVCNYNNRYQSQAKDFYVVIEWFRELAAYNARNPTAQLYPMVQFFAPATIDDPCTDTGEAVDSTAAVQIPHPDVYIDAIKKFRARFPQVKDFVTHNEVTLQPRLKTRPDLLAGYYRRFRNVCAVAPTCKVAAGSFVDYHDSARPYTGVKGDRTYVRQFAAHMGARNVKIWAFHSYASTIYINENDKNGNPIDPEQGMRALIRDSTFNGDSALGNGNKIWLTEGGPLVEGHMGWFKTPTQMSGRFDSWLKKLTNPTDDKYDRVTRFYTYSWDGDERCAPAGWQQNCFDSGMIDIANGATRPAYSVLDKYTP